jgi:hypothetical protein
MRYIRASILLFSLVFSASALAELKVYDVDARYRQEVYAALRGVLSPRNREVVGSLSMLPSGQILIDTSAEMHGQVAAVLRAIAEHQSEPSPRVTLRYWAVLGSRESSAGDAPPEILSDVLDELERVHGDLSFRVLGNATLVTESGQEGELDGTPLSIRQQVYVEGSTLNTELEILFRYRLTAAAFQAGNADPANPQANPFQTIRVEEQRVELNTSMRPGEFVVVGENTIRENTITDGVLDGTIFYIVNWPDTQ